MSQNSNIEWTQSTWNPVTGCTKVSDGCEHCYAERFSERFRGVKGHVFESGFDLIIRENRIDQPRFWKKPRLIFVNSMSDLFHKDIPVEYIDRVFDTMESAEWHTYQILTKRSSLMRSFVNNRYSGRPTPAHIWLGVSVECSSTLNRIQHLKQTQGSVRFVSFEPLLGPIGPVDLTEIDWVIAGGESGANARKMDIGWLREIRNQCQKFNVAFFFKQWGGRTPKSGGNMLDGKQWMEYPHTALDIPIEPFKHHVPGVPSAESSSTAPMQVGPWAKEKLECLRKYLCAYTVVLRRQHFKGYFYIDAFSGPGILQIRKPTAKYFGFRELLNQKEFSEYIDGSPRVALSIDNPFTHYIFIEKDSNRIEDLESLKAEFSSESVSIVVRKIDCNEYLKRFLKKGESQWTQWRGIIFLDPFGMQVPWETIERIGRTKSIEVIINFPVGMAIQRLLKRDARFTTRERKKLNDYFGSDEWFDLLYKRERNFFGIHSVKRGQAAEILVSWYRKRLEKVFGHASPAREIRRPDGHLLYYLIWAGRNKTGAKIASAVLKQGARSIC